MSANAYVIHLATATKREPFVADLRAAIPNLQVFNAIVDDNPVRGCARSHQSIVFVAKKLDLPYIWILEDDCVLAPWFNMESWNNTIALADANNYGVVNGGTIHGQVPHGSGLPNLVNVRQFASCHCWVAFKRAYDDILALDPLIDIDVALGKIPYKKCVRVPFVGKQAPDYSSLRKRDVDYMPLYNNEESQLMAYLGKS